MKLMSRIAPHAVNKACAAVASGILFLAMAQWADAAAIKAPVDGASGTVAKAPPVSADWGCRCGYGGYRGGYRGYGRYRG